MSRVSKNSWTITSISSVVWMCIASTPSFSQDASSQSSADNSSSSSGSTSSSELDVRVIYTIPVSNKEENFLDKSWGGLQVAWMKTLKEKNDRTLKAGIALSYDFAAGKSSTVSSIEGYSIAIPGEPGSGQTSLVHFVNGEVVSDEGDPSSAKYKTKAILQKTLKAELHSLIAKGIISADFSFVHVSLGAGVGVLFGHLESTNNKTTVYTEQADLNNAKTFQSNRSDRLPIFAPVFTFDLSTGFDITQLIEQNTGKDCKINVSLDVGARNNNLILPNMKIESHIQPTSSLKFVVEINDLKKKKR